MIRALSTATILLLIPAFVHADDHWPTEFDWGELKVSDDAIHLHVSAVPKDGVIRIPRLHCTYETLYLQSDAEKKMLKLWPDIDHWQITLPKESRTSDQVVVMETVGKPQFFEQTPTVEPHSDGQIDLPAHMASVHGEKLRFEPQPHKNTVGYWTIESDWCHWKLKVAKAGRYEVHIWQGCGKDQGGSEVEVQSGKSKFTFIRSCSSDH